MHKNVEKFLGKTRYTYSHFFEYEVKNALDCGSLDINGNNRWMFSPKTQYTGIDIVEGRNVDVVTKVSEFHPAVKYDVVISTEMLEHDAEWKESLQAMVSFLAPQGMLIITAAGEGRPEHGTSRCNPQDSPLTHDYYRNVISSMFTEALNADLFCRYQIDTYEDDIYFLGILK